MKIQIGYKWKIDVKCVPCVGFIPSESNCILFKWDTFQCELIQFIPFNLLSKAFIFFFFELLCSTQGNVRLRVKSVESQCLLLTLLQRNVIELNIGFLFNNKMERHTPFWSFVSIFFKSVRNSQQNMRQICWDREQLNHAFQYFKRSNCISAWLIIFCVLHELIYNQFLIVLLDGAAGCHSKCIRRPCLLANLWMWRKEGVK